MINKTQLKSDYNYYIDLFESSNNRKATVSEKKLLMDYLIIKHTEAALLKMIIITGVLISFISFIIQIYFKLAI